MSDAANSVVTHVCTCTHETPPLEGPGFKVTPGDMPDQHAEGCTVLRCVDGCPVKVWVVTADDLDPLPRAIRALEQGDGATLRELRIPVLAMLRELKERRQCAGCGESLKFSETYCEDCLT